MKTFKFFKTALLAAMICVPFAHADQVKIGVVDTNQCVEKSYLGQSETQKFESLRGEMLAVIEQHQNKIREVDEKLNDKDFMDTINPQAEEDLMKQRAALYQEFQMINQTAQQSFEQASQKFSSEIKASMNKVSEHIAHEKGFDLIIDKNLCFYYQSPNDITQLIVQEMNRHFTPDADSEDAQGK